MNLLHTINYIHKYNVYSLHEKVVVYILVAQRSTAAHAWVYLGLSYYVVAYVL